MSETFWWRLAKAIPQILPHRSQLCFFISQLFMCLKTVNRRRVLSYRESAVTEWMIEGVDKWIPLFWSLYKSCIKLDIYSSNLTTENVKLRGPLHLRRRRKRGVIARPPSDIIISKKVFRVKRAVHDVWPHAPKLVLSAVPLKPVQAIASPVLMRRLINTTVPNQIPDSAFPVGLCRARPNCRLLCVAVGTVSIVLTWTLTRQLIIWRCRYDDATIINVPAPPLLSCCPNENAVLEPQLKPGTWALSVRDSKATVLPRYKLFFWRDDALFSQPLTANCYAQSGRLWPTGDTTLRCPSAAAGLWDLVKTCGGQ